MTDKKNGDDLAGEIGEAVILGMIAIVGVIGITFPKKGWQKGYSIGEESGWKVLVAISVTLASLYLLMLEAFGGHLGKLLFLLMQEYVPSWASAKLAPAFVLKVCIPLVLFGMQTYFVPLSLGAIASSVWRLVTGAAGTSGKSLGAGKKLSGNYSFNSKHVKNALLKQHQIVFGVPGSGKTYSALSPQVLEAIKSGESVFIVDPKGDNSFRDDVFTFCREHKKSEDFKYFSINNTDLSTSFNPFGGCGANEVKDMIISATNWSEPHYKKMAELHIIKTVQKLGENPTISEILTNLPNVKELSGIRADLEMMKLSEYGKLIDDKNADSMFDLYEQGAVVFISLDTQAYPEASTQLGKIFLGSILSVSNKIQSSIRESERKKTTVFVDEFGSFLTESFINFVSKARSSNFRIILATQSVGDLEVFKPEMRKRIMDSISNKIVLNMSDPESIEYCSKLFGTKSVVKETKQIERSGLFLENRKETGVLSEREVEEFVVHPKDIRELARGWGFVMTQNPYGVYRVQFKPSHHKMKRFSYVSYVDYRNYWKERFSELGESEQEEEVLEATQGDHEDFLEAPIIPVIKKDPGSISDRI